MHQAKNKNTKPNFVSKYSQTYRLELKTSVKQTQTSNDEMYTKFQRELSKITNHKTETERLLNISKTDVEKQSYENENLKQRNIELDTMNKNLIVINTQIKSLNETLQSHMERLKTEIYELQKSQSSQIDRTNTELFEKNQYLMKSIKKIEDDKNTVLAEYKELLDNERKQFLEKNKSMQLKLKDLQAIVDE